MKNTIKRLLAAAVAVTMILACAFTAFAEYDYYIDGLYWDVNEDAGAVTARWDHCEGHHSYKVQLYKKGFNSSQELGSCVFEKTVTENSLYVSDIIKDKGRGIYTVAVTPTGSSQKKDDKVYTDGLEVDEFLFTRIKGSQIKSAKHDEGWQQTSTGWEYIRSDGNVAADTWLLWQNNWYYFNSDGKMLTGWQWLNGACYYLNPADGAGGYPLGACWMNGTTPDGFTVNASGAWTVDGKVQTP